MGLQPLCLKSASTVERSYVKPSPATTGSSISCLLMGQQRPSGSVINRFTSVLGRARSTLKNSAVDKSGNGHPSIHRILCNGYINPYYWVDGHPEKPSYFHYTGSSIRILMTVYNNHNWVVESPIHTKQPEFIHCSDDANAFHLEFSSLCFRKLPASDPQPRNIELLL